jgi:hypothetical protein
MEIGVRSVNRIFFLLLVVGIFAAHGRKNRITGAAEVAGDR